MPLGHISKMGVTLIQKYDRCELSAVGKRIQRSTTSFYIFSSSTCMLIKTSIEVDADVQALANLIPLNFDYCFDSFLIYRANLITLLKVSEAICRKLQNNLNLSNGVGTTRSTLTLSLLISSEICVKQAGYGSTSQICTMLSMVALE